MPHKYTKEDTIRRLEEELATIELSIRRSKTISVGDRGSFEALKEQVKDFMETARDKKNNALDFLETGDGKNYLGGEYQQKLAYICRGQEKAFEIILDLMDNPQSSVGYYENHKKIVEEDLKRYRSYEVRPSEPTGN